MAADLSYIQSIIIWGVGNETQKLTWLRQYMGLKQLVIHVSTVNSGAGLDGRLNNNKLEEQQEKEARRWEQCKCLQHLIDSELMYKLLM